GGKQEKESKESKSKSKEEQKKDKDTAENAKVPSLKNSKVEKHSKEEKKDKKLKKEKGETKEEAKQEEERLAEKKEEIKEELLDVKEEPPEEDSRETNGRAEAERNASSGSKASRTRQGHPAEALQTYDPASSGLSAEQLAALPPDATDPKAFEDVYKRTFNVEPPSDTSPGLGTLYFDCDGTRFQVTNKPVGDNWYAAFRVARACWTQLRNGTSKEDALTFRKKCYDDFKLASGEVVKETARKRNRPERSDQNRDRKKRRREEKKKKKRPVTESTESSSSSESCDSSASHTEHWPARMACAKMQVRSGLRCLCHFEVVCPGKMKVLNAK
ncbi:unnamed protein product, partial [Durusdinium trenchii]